MKFIAISHRYVASYCADGGAQFDDGELHGVLCDTPHFSQYSSPPNRGLVAAGGQRASQSLGSDSSRGAFPPVQRCVAPVHHLVGLVVTRRGFLRLDGWLGRRADCCNLALWLSEGCSRGAFDGWRRRGLIVAGHGCFDWSALSAGRCGAGCWFGQTRAAQAQIPASRGFSPARCPISWAVLSYLEAGYSTNLELQDDLSNRIKSP
jgi:hypothetical protein